MYDSSYEQFIRTHCWYTNKHASCSATGKLVPIIIYGGNRVYVHEDCKEAAMERNRDLVENLRARSDD